MEEPFCENCGTTESVDITYNPYLKEMFDDDSECYLCKECFKELAQGV